MDLRSWLCNHDALKIWHSCMHHRLWVLRVS